MSRQKLLVLFTALVMALSLAGVATATTEAAAKPKKPALKVFKKLGTKAPKRAPGPRWIGAYHVKKSKRLIYRIDPSGRHPRKLGRVKRVGAVPGTVGKKPRRASVKRTAKFAYVVSTYGLYRKIRAQAMAVDLLGRHYIQGKAWRLNGKKTKKLVRSVRLGPTALRFARMIDKQARNLAGPYRIEVNGDAVGVGRETTLRAKVTSATGTPMGGYQVQFAVNGSPAGTGKTSKNGTVTVPFVPAGTGGWQDVTASVADLPDATLRVRRGIKQKRLTRVVVASPRTEGRVGVGRLAVIARQRISVLPPFDPRAGTGAQLTPHIQVESYAEGGSAQVATTTLRGPFPTQDLAAASCTTNTGPDDVLAMRTDTIAVAAGNVTAPTVPVSTEGWFAIQVDLDGNEINAPIASCGAVHKALRTPQVKTYIAVGPEYRVPYQCPSDVCTPRSPLVYQDVTLTYEVSELPRGYDSQLKVTSTETYPSAVVEYPNCTNPNVSDHGTIRVSGPGRYTTTVPIQVYDGFSIRVSELQFQAKFGYNEFMVPTVTPCGAQRFALGD